MTTWKGFKELIVVDKVQEDDVTTSLYLKDVEGKALPDYLPGQFITVKVKIDETQTSKPRAYSLSTKYKGDYYRISIKREEHGAVSPLLCDKVQKGDMLLSTAPAGKFVLEDSDRPAVFIGGGIGVTPMLAMAETLEGSDRKAHLLYSTRNSNFHSFQDEIKAISDHYENVTTKIFYTRPLEGEVEGKDYDICGRISKEWMQENLPLDAEFYFCGPVPFMKTMYHIIESLGVSEEHIYYEFFEPGIDIRKLDD